MIRWPKERRLTHAAQKNLSRFRATAAADELAVDPHTWEVLATSWFDEFPVRIVWRNEERREVCFTLEETGLWRLARYDTLPVAPNPNDPLSTSALMNGENRASAAGEIGDKRLTMPFHDTRPRGLSEAN